MLNPGWRTTTSTRGGKMGSSQEGTPPHPSLKITLPEGAVLLRSFLHLALRGHPHLYPGQEEIRSPLAGKEEGCGQKQRKQERLLAVMLSQSLPLGSPRGQSKDRTLRERGASFLGGHSGLEGTSEPLLLRWGTPVGDERMASRACMEPTTLTFLGCPAAGPWSGCCRGGRCPPGGRDWGFGRGRGWP